MRLLYDIEANGFYDEVTKIHCIEAVDIDTLETFSYGPEQIPEGIEKLNNATLLAGHNIARYDHPVVEKVHPKLYRFTKEMLDTYAIACMITYDTLRRGDWARMERGVMPKKYYNKQSLEAWGYRLGERKAEYDGGFEEWSPTMQAYCKQDVQSNLRLLLWLMQFERRKGKPAATLQAMITESKVAHILFYQEQVGVGFDAKAGAALYAKLNAERDAIKAKLQKIVPPWEVEIGLFTPKRDNKTRGYIKGIPFMKKKTLEFNPGSDHHVGDRLQVLYGWKPGPDQWTKNGIPKTDEETLADLRFEIIPDLLRYRMLDKKLGQISDGKEAWLRKEKGGRIYGRIKPTGTRTSRMSHSGPNLGQVPKVGKPYGAECRELFGPQEAGYLVGCDASGLELRILSNRLYPWDGGAFAKDVLDGDVHTKMQDGTGIYIRDNQKTWTYAKLYGAWYFKLGNIIINDIHDAVRTGILPPDTKIPSLSKAPEMGKKSEKMLLKKMPALKFLLEACARAHKRGWIKLIDGLYVRSASEHSALNTLCQGDGARVMKVAQWILQEKLDWASFKRASHYAQIEYGMADYGWNLTVHDEWQIETKHEEIAHEIGKLAAESITEAGHYLNMKVPLAGEYAVGRNWKETH